MSYIKYEEEGLTDQLQLLVVILTEKKKDVKRNCEMKTKREGQEMFVITQGSKAMKCILLGDYFP